MMRALAKVVKSLSSVVVNNQRFIALWLQDTVS